MIFVSSCGQKYNISSRIIVNISRCQSSSSRLYSSIKRSKSFSGCGGIFFFLRTLERSRFYFDYLNSISHRIAIPFFSTSSSSKSSILHASFGRMSTDQYALEWQVRHLKCFYLFFSVLMLIRFHPFSCR